MALAARERRYGCVSTRSTSSPVDERVLEMAFASSGNDFEDNVQVACAMIAAVDCIVSRDATGLSNPVIPVRNADEIVSTL